VSDLHFELRFLGPRYWGNALLIGLIGIGVILPRSVASRIGAALGDLFRWGNTKRRRIAEVNLRLCFPELDSHTRQKMVVEHFRAYGRSIIDLGLVWWASENRLDQICRVRGLDEWSNRINAGEPTLLITPHMVGIDIGGVYLSRFYPIVSMMKRAENPLLTWRLWRGRSRFGAEVILRDQGIRPMVRGLIEGRVGYIMPDENLVEGRSVFVSFFGVRSATLSVVGRLSRLTGAKVVPMFTRRLDSGHYEIDIHQPLESFPTGDDLADAERINQVFEEGIRLAPEQYLWTLQWFKTLPHGKPSPYS
jgi:lauroyl/myristoyl acyltransferase